MTDLTRSTDITSVRARAHAAAVVVELPSSRPLDVPLPNVELPDVDLRPLRDGASLLVTPSGRVFDVDVPPVQLVHALGDLVARPEDPSWPELADLLALEEPVRARRQTHDILLIVDTAFADAARRAASPDQQVHQLPSHVDDVTRLAAGSADKILLVLRDRFDPALFTTIDDARAVADAPWLPVHLDHARAWVGPLIQPGVTASYRDLLARRWCAEQPREVADALFRPSVTGPLRPPAPATLAWLVALALDLAQRWAEGGPSPVVGNEVEVDPHRLAVVAHPVLPLPTGDLGQVPNDVHAGVAVLHSARTGVVTHVRTIEHHPSVPRELATVQAEVADMARVLPWAPNTVCGGSVFGDHAAAHASAIGESVERYCGNVVRPDRLRRASCAQLREAGEHVLDPSRLVLYSDTQYEAPGFPFVRFTDDLPVHWVLGRSLTHGRETWVPASWAYVNWHVGPFADEPRTNFPIFAGLAAGDGLDDAVRSGLQEVVERDATMVWWANRQQLPVVEPSPRMAALLHGGPDDHGMRAWLVALENSFGIPVMAGVVENLRDHRFAVGFGCRPDPEQAALKAWAEAFTLHEISRDLDEPDGKFWESVRRGAKRQGSMKPWRADRAYLDDYRADFRDVCDLESQMQVMLDPRARDIARPLTRSDCTVPLDAVPALGDGSMATIQRLVESRGYEVIVVDVTTPDVAQSGLRVVRVVVPGLASNYPAAFPFNGRRRLQDAAMELGWRCEPLPEHELNLFPLPHA